MKTLKWAGLIVLGIFLAAGPAAAQDWASGSFAIGAYGGYAFSVSDDAIDKVEKSDFDNFVTFGGGVMYRFPFGLALGADVSYIDFDLKIPNLGGNLTEVGSLRQFPVMFWVRWQGKPEGTGFTGHVGAGAGLNLTSFDEKTAQLGTAKVEPENEFVWGAEAGVDYFITPELSVSLDGRFLWSEIDYKTEGLATFATWQDTGKIKGHNISVLLGLKYWFALY